MDLHLVFVVELCYMMFRLFEYLLSDFKLFNAFFQTKAFHSSYYTYAFFFGSTFHYLKRIQLKAGKKKERKKESTLASERFVLFCVVVDTKRLLFPEQKVK